MGVASPVLEILLPLKMANFPFRTMDYSPWSSKNLLNQNWPKKIMQVDTNLGGHGYSGFGDTATFKNSKISLSGHGL